VRLREDRTAEDFAGLAEELLSWSLTFRSPAVAQLRPRPCSYPPFPKPARLEPASRREGQRARLLRATIDLTLRDCYEDLSVPRIAEEAGLSIDSLLAL